MACNHTERHTANHINTKFTKNNVDKWQGVQCCSFELCIVTTYKFEVTTRKWTLIQIKFLLDYPYPSHDKDQPSQRTAHLLRWFPVPTVDAGFYEGKPRPNVQLCIRESSKMRTVDRRRERRVCTIRRRNITALLTCPMECSKREWLAEGKTRYPQPSILMYRSRWNSGVSIILTSKGWITISLWTTSWKSWHLKHKVRSM